MRTRGMGVEKTAKRAGGAGKGGGGRGTCFERLQAVADLHYDDSADDAAYQVVLDGIGACEELVRKYAQTNGFRSEQVRGAIDEWAGAFLADLGATRDQLRDGHDVVVQARGAMRQARDLFNQNVSPELLTGAERGWRAAADGAGAVAFFAVPVVGAVAMVASELYWSGLEKERDREREEYCQNVLDQMNASLNEGAERMQGIIDKGGNGGWTRDSSHKTPAIDPLPGVVDPNLMGGGAGAVQDPPPYRRLSDVDGVGLVERPVNQTVTPNGLVGGYAPPSATHASDPRWDPYYRIPKDAVSVGRAASSGALGALAGGAGVSARSLLSGAATTGLRAAAAAKGAAGVGAALKGAAAAARGGAGGVMGMGAPVGGAGGEGEDKKKRRAFTGVFKDEPDEEAGPVWDPAHGPGSADDDIVLEVDLDEWGL